MLGADAEPRSLARGAVGRIRRSARAMRGAPPRPRRRLRPARRHAGLHAAGGRHREGIPRHAGQADLEPRGRPGARLLPPDLAVQDVGRPRRERRTGRPARASRPASRSTPGSIRSASSSGKDMRQLQGWYEDAGRRAARLHRAEPADRIRDAQHARSGRPVARRQHQPERPSTWSASSRSARGRPARTRSNSAAP